MGKGDSAVLLSQKVTNSGNMEVRYRHGPGIESIKAFQDILKYLEKGKDILLMKRRRPYPHEHEKDDVQCAGRSN